ncbi:hypothetical protein QCA50_012874 [Cerrena zonata]|uniref:Protein Zds1 C-terminal domain-containing protein n=1 Tax=Cerrena zonata TaxID=2478898 RepID=A0AAW0FQE8_9APHY
MGPIFEYLTDIDVEDFMYDFKTEFCTLQGFRDHVFAPFTEELVDSLDSSNDEFFDAEGNDEPLDTNSLLWVPANLHPEVDPENFKNHIKTQVEEIMERKLSRQNSVLKRSSLSSSSLPVYLDSSEDSSDHNLSPEQLKVDEQEPIEKENHTEKETLTENEQKQQQDQDQDLKQQNRTSYQDKRFSNPSLRDLTNELETLSRLAGMDSNDAVTLARTLSTTSLGYTDVEKQAIDELNSSPPHGSPSSSPNNEIDVHSQNKDTVSSPTSHKSLKRNKTIPPSSSMSSKSPTKYQQSVGHYDSASQNLNALEDEQLMSSNQQNDRDISNQPQMVPQNHQYPHQQFFQQPSQAPPQQAPPQPMPQQPQQQLGKPYSSRSTKPQRSNDGLYQQQHQFHQSSHHEYPLKRSRRLDYHKQSSVMSLGSQLQTNKAGKLAELRNNLNLGDSTLIPSHRQHQHLHQPESQEHKPKLKLKTKSPNQQPHPRSSQMLFSYRNPNVSPPGATSNTVSKDSPYPTGASSSIEQQLNSKFNHSHSHHNKKSHIKNPSGDSTNSSNSSSSITSPNYNDISTGNSAYPANQRYPGARSASYGSIPTNHSNRSSRQQKYGFEGRPAGAKSPTEANHTDRPPQARSVSHPQLQATVDGSKSGSYQCSSTNQPISKNDKSKQLNQNLNMLRSEINEFKESLNKADRPSSQPPQSEPPQSQPPQSQPPQSQPPQSQPPQSQPPQSQPPQSQPPQSQPPQSQPPQSQPPKQALPLLVQKELPQVPDEASDDVPPRIIPEQYIQQIDSKNGSLSPSPQQQHHSYQDEIRPGSIVDNAGFGSPTNSDTNDSDFSFEATYQDISYEDSLGLEQEILQELSDEAQIKKQHELQLQLQKQFQSSMDNVANNSYDDNTGENKYFERTSQYDDEKTVTHDPNIDDFNGNTAPEEINEFGQVENGHEEYPHEQEEGFRQIEEPLEQNVSRSSSTVKHEPSQIENDDSYDYVDMKRTLPQSQAFGNYDENKFISSSGYTGVSTSQDPFQQSAMVAPTSQSAMVYPDEFGSSQLSSPQSPSDTQPQSPSRKSLKKKKSWPWLKEKERTSSLSSVDASNLPPVPDSNNLQSPTRSVSSPEVPTAKEQKPMPVEIYEPELQIKDYGKGRDRKDSVGKENMITKFFKKKRSNSTSVPVSSPNQPNLAGINALGEVSGSPGAVNAKTSSESGVTVDYESDSESKSTRSSNSKKKTSGGGIFKKKTKKSTDKEKERLFKSNSLNSIKTHSTETSNDEIQGKEILIDAETEERNIEQDIQMDDHIQQQFDSQQQSQNDHLIQLQFVEDNGEEPESRKSSKSKKHQKKDKDPEQHMFNIVVTDGEKKSKSHRKKSIERERKTSGEIERRELTDDKQLRSQEEQQSLDRKERRRKRRKQKEKQAAAAADAAAAANDGSKDKANTSEEEKSLQTTQEVQEKLKKSIKRTSRANQPIEFTDSAFGFPLPPPSQSTLVMLDYRFPVHVERAIYRLSHLKLANPKRSLREQVLLSNFMYAYLNLVDHTLHLEQQMNTEQSSEQEDDSKYGDDSMIEEEVEEEYEENKDLIDDTAGEPITIDLDITEESQVRA